MSTPVFYQCMYILDVQRRDSAHPKLYGKEYGTYGRQPARARMREDVLSIELLMSSDTLPPRDPATPKTSLGGLVAIEYSGPVCQPTLINGILELPADSTHVEICGDMTCESTVHDVPGVTPCMPFGLSLPLCLMWPTLATPGGIGIVVQ
ncbi:hypothetical protein B0H19DRAFT_1078174 [Mycena capillaripes]|nr:hypothetical protein B0H19DRAFT_1078174 [Mycena capillaripes]